MRRPGPADSAKTRNARRRIAQACRHQRVKVLHFDYFNALVARPGSPAHGGASGCRAMSRTHGCEMDELGHRGRDDSLRHAAARLRRADADAPIRVVSRPRTLDAVKALQDRVRAAAAPIRWIPDAVTARGVRRPSASAGRVVVAVREY